MHIKTKLTKISRNPKNQNGFVNPGIYKGSTIIFNSFKEYIDDLKKRDDNKVKYGIHLNPSFKQLESAISFLYNAKDTVIAPTGLSAITIPFLAYLKKGDEVLITDSVYNPTRTFCENILKNFDIKIKYFHPTNYKNFNNLINKKTKLIFLESPGTATFDIMDIPKITNIAKRKKIITILDNTWASPIFCQPFNLGIDIIVDAGTKYINGYSDVLIGFVSSRKQQDAKIIRSTIKSLGIIPGSEEVYLSMRGITTLHVRIKEIEKNAINLAKKLSNHKLISKVYHPALPSMKNHVIWKRDFSGSTGLFAFEFKKKYSNNTLEKFYKKLKIFKNWI